MLLLVSFFGFVIFAVVLVMLSVLVDIQDTLLDMLDILSNYDIEVTKIDDELRKL